MRKNLTTKILLLFMIVLVCAGLSACAGGSDAANVPKDPTVPQMNSAVVADDGVIDVVWNTMDGAEGYEIYKATSKDGEYTLAAKADADVRVYNDAEVELYKQYYYKVKALINGETTEFSNAVSAFTEGQLLTNSKMRIAAENENGVTLKYPTGSSLIGQEGKYTCTFIFEDEVCTDFEILCDTERLNVQIADDGIVTIQAVEQGQYIITFAKGEEKGSFLYYPEIGEEGAFTYDWPGNPTSRGKNNLFPVEDSKSAKVPNHMQSLLTVKYNGAVTNDFVVEVSDPEICQVEQNETNVTVTNLMPGKCQLIFSNGEEKTVFEWVAKGGRIAGLYKTISSQKINSVIYAEDGSVDVVLNDIGAEAYEIYRATSKDGNYTKIATVSSENHIYNDKDVELYKNYYYKVVTAGNENNLEYSKSVSVFTEGTPVHVSNVEFFTRSRTYPSGQGFQTDLTPVYFTIKFGGKTTADFEVYYDKENLTITKDGKGNLTVTPKAAGRYLITVVKGRNKGTFLYNAEMLPEGQVTFDCKQYSEVQNSMSVKVPRVKESVLTMKSPGGIIEDFQVFTSDEDVCTVRKDGSKVIVTNNNPGKCNIIVTYKGETTVFEWIVRSGAATAPYTYVDGIAVSESIAKEKANEIVTKFTSAKYSEADIKELAKANLTLEEAAEKISTVQDAVNYLHAKGMGMGYMQHPVLKVGGMDWSSQFSAKFTYERLAGNCGAISNLMNKFLEDDYDSQGYVIHTVNFGGHTYNFFIKDGMYYICDFTGCFDRNETDKSIYLMLVTDDIDKLTEYYKRMYPQYNNPESEDYLYHLYAYELDGHENVDRGELRSNWLYTGMGEPICNYLPDTIEDTVHMLYVEDSLEIFFAKAPTRDQYPPEENTPKE